MGMDVNDEYIRLPDNIRDIDHSTMFPSCETLIVCGIEFGATEQMFFKPTRKETEDYITGRFG